MNYDIFKDGKDRANAVRALDTLMNHEGWEYLQRAIDANIQYFDEQLHEKLREDAFDKEVSRLQDKIDFLDFLKMLPAILTSEAQNLPEEDEESDDPYDLSSTSQP